MRTCKNWLIIQHRKLIDNNQDNALNTIKNIHNVKVALAKNIQQEAKKGPYLKKKYIGTILHAYL